MPFDSPNGLKDDDRHPEGWRARLESFGLALKDGEPKSAVESR